MLIQHLQPKTIALFACYLLTSGFSFAAKPIGQDLRPGWNTIKQASLRSDISYLAADRLTGRLALTSGDDQSIDWIVSEFKKAGLKPGNGSSYLQTFNVVEYTPDHKNNYLRLESNKTKQTWKKPDIVTDFNADIDLTAAVTFVGYGITAPALQYDDYSNIDVHNKIVVAFEHEPQETNAKSIFNGTGNTPFATTRVKALNAEVHGALALIIVPEPNRKHPSNQERYAKIGGSVARKIPLPAMMLTENELHIPVVIVSDAIAKQIAGSLNLSELQRHIDADLHPASQMIPEINLVIHEHVLTKKIKPTSNVVGLFEGSDPTLKAETILISAHHDHDGKSGKEIWHGADDNASGTAGVVALAHALVTNSVAADGLKPKRSILFSVFAAEERGLLGSYYMAAHPLRPVATTRAMINFDMIGRDEKPSPQTDGLINIPADTHNRLNLIGAHFSPDYSAIVTQQNQYVGLMLDHRFDSENALNTFFRSDQFPFVLQKVPALWWFTGFHPDYHHTTDTADKINYTKLQKILRLAYLTTYQFANQKTPPLFIEYPNPRRVD